MLLVVDYGNTVTLTIKSVFYVFQRENISTIDLFPHFLPHILPFSLILDPYLLDHDSCGDDHACTSVPHTHVFSGLVDTTIQNLLDFQTGSPSSRERNFTPSKAAAERTAGERTAEMVKGQLRG